jgi:hypothetical protein
MVRVAAALFVATALLGVFFAAANWFLVEHTFAWSTLPALLIAGLNFLIAVKLLQLRYWALILARILTIWLAVGYITLFATGRLMARLPVVGLATVVEVIITAALVVTLFMPSVRKAFPKPSQPASA